MGAAVSVINALCLCFSIVFAIATGGGRQRAGRHSFVRRVIHAVGDIWVLCRRPWVVVNARSVTWEVETTPSVPSQPSCGGGPYSRDTRPPLPLYYYYSSWCPGPTFLCPGSASGVGILSNPGRRQPRRRPSTSPVEMIPRCTGSRRRPEVTTQLQPIHPFMNRRVHVRRPQAMGCFVLCLPEAILWVTSKRNRPLLGSVGFAPLVAHLIGAVRPSVAS
ncbi:hypothetical protein B296_00038073 [Ensete ventricosum]|uniref:Secreted protein n=1 Tax=Ensete ventricosum TaxID=4639 RepID=A0A426ZXL8_ENSVE|nr:hypothetical protein B296_00038073 [Ensete ventricosum]